MILDNLYNKILIEPLKKDSHINKLFIISGYATANMCLYHMQDLIAEKKNIGIHLLIGMASKDGISIDNHTGLKELSTKIFYKEFECSYIVENPPVHSKVYLWCADNKPVAAFTGSANYTQTAFVFGKQKNAMTPCNPDDCMQYFDSLIGNTIICTHPDAETNITIHKKEKLKDTYSHLPHETISLLHKNTHVVPEKSGLNWGQREGRNPNQAYISLNAKIYNSDFFPPRKVHFTILTDDNKSLIATRAQDNAKAIHTPHNNSLIGEYFRNRLGLPNGTPVTIKDLQKYGRTDVVIHKIDDETYYMDFSSPKRHS